LVVTKNAGCPSHTSPISHDMASRLLCPSYSLSPIIIPKTVSLSFFLNSPFLRLRKYIILFSLLKLPPTYYLVFGISVHISILFITPIPMLFVHQSFHTAFIQFCTVGEDFLVMATTPNQRRESSHLVAKAVSIVPFFNSYCVSPCQFQLCNTLAFFPTLSSFQKLQLTSRHLCESNP